MSVQGSGVWWGCELCSMNAYFVIANYKHLTMKLFRSFMQVIGLNLR